MVRSARISTQTRQGERSEWAGLNIRKRSYSMIAIERIEYLLWIMRSWFALPCKRDKNSWTQKYRLDHLVERSRWNWDLARCSPQNSYTTFCQGVDALFRGKSHDTAISLEECFRTISLYVSGSPITITITRRDSSPVWSLWGQKLPTGGRAMLHLEMTYVLTSQQQRFSIGLSLSYIVIS